MKIPAKLFRCFFSVLLAQRIQVNGAVVCADSIEASQTFWNADVTNDHRQTAGVNLVTMSCLLFDNIQTHALAVQSGPAREPFVNARYQQMETSQTDHNGSQWAALWIMWICRALCVGCLWCHHKAKLSGPGWSHCTECYNKRHKTYQLHHKSKKTLQARQTGILANPQLRFWWISQPWFIMWPWWLLITLQVISIGRSHNWFPLCSMRFIYHQNG